MNAKKKLLWPNPDSANTIWFCLVVNIVQVVIRSWDGHIGWIFWSLKSVFAVFSGKTLQQLFEREISGNMQQSVPLSFETLWTWMCRDLRRVFQRPPAQSLSTGMQATFGLRTPVRYRFYNPAATNDFRELTFTYFYSAVMWIVPQFVRLVRKSASIGVNIADVTRFAVNRVVLAWYLNWILRLLVLVVSYKAVTLWTKFIGIMWLAVSTL